MNAQKILVFGVKAHFSRVLAWVLAYKGHQVKMASSPAEALRALIDEDYDLIIAKLAMEDLQSLDVIKRAKKLNPEGKIVVLSGDFLAAFPLEAYQIEVEDYLLLPITSKELVRRVGLCLERLAQSIVASTSLAETPGTGEG
jgi:DNA-binding response OmpR family regulator